MPLNTLSDQELAELLRNGDHTAFTEIYDRYKDTLYRHAYRWLQDRETVRDVIQEIFTIIWNKRSHIVFNQNLSGYLYSSVRHATLRKINQQNGARQYMQSLQQYADRCEADTDFLIREKQIREMIDTAVQQLPEKMQEVFKLSRYEHLTHAEIAARLDITELTVRTHIKKALRILRSELGVLVYLYLLFRH